MLTQRKGLLFFMKKSSETLNKARKFYITAQSNNFVIVSHNIARNQYLSDSAKSLYIYLKSHSENFYLSQRQIANYFDISMHKIELAMLELKENGFLKIEKLENKNQWRYILLDNPTLKDLPNYQKDTIINAFKTSETKFWEKKTKGRTSKKRKKIEDINRNFRTENRIHPMNELNCRM